MNKKLVVSIFIVALMLVGGELFARYYLGLGDPPLSVEHETIEYMFRPNQEVERFGNRIKINEYGMRSNSFPREKQNDELRILLFGDSVLNGGSLTDQNELASSILEKRLSNHSRVTVGNISAGSWGPGNLLAYSKEYGFFESDIIVLLISSHDYNDVRSFEPLSFKTHPRNKPFSAFTEGITRYLPRYLPDVLSFESESSDNVTEGFKKNARTEMEALLKSAQANSSKTFVFMHWEKSELNNNTLKEGGMNIIKLCEQMDIDIVSLEQYYNKVIKNGDSIYRDNIHLNAKGQEILANAIHEKIKKEISF